MDQNELIESDRYRAERAAGESIGHQPSYIVIMNDMSYCRCSCGWESQHYFDGFRFAHLDWVLHIQDLGAKIAYPV